MGRESRLNPRSMDGGTSPTDAFRARLVRFGQFFATRAQYEDYLDGRDISDAERAVLEQHLPSHLQAQGTV